MTVAEKELTRAETTLAQSSQRSSHSTRTLSLTLQVLEQEIFVLRNAMERMYREQATFQSELVIDLSRQLDVKINEYMHYSCSLRA
ncbi:Spo0E like sporulation regulatory protein [Paenibacillus cellulosilyticus]|uniref:Spo0E like sporulation regulatory protein n=1 Tax=Paenibacillus cellulosilyticus TaxID=375489 RepID=A0A2V2Z2R9_9BACL|nr:Spo0E like sporulation regulatory protein [Paenibacillus cellulosilyticus]QKS44429.1 aspartyl-phosphate phosphatase Spo0E family protein [Paenibacillus cellulosilyticus]